MWIKLSESMVLCFTNLIIHINERKNLHISHFSRITKCHLCIYVMEGSQVNKIFTIRNFVRNMLLFWYNTSHFNLCSTHNHIYAYPLAYISGKYLALFLNFQFSYVTFSRSCQIVFHRLPVTHRMPPALHQNPQVVLPHLQHVKYPYSRGL